jgi:hypothetical protein
VDNPKQNNNKPGRNRIDKLDPFNSRQPNNPESRKRNNVHKVLETEDSVELAAGQRRDRVVPQRQLQRTSYGQ